MNDLYIYYRVRDEHAPRLAATVRAMQADLAASFGVAGQLKRRPGSDDGLQTWMEIYLATGEGFTDALGAAERAAELSTYIEGKRHTEVFTDISPCA